MAYKLLKVMLKITQSYEQMPKIILFLRNGAMNTEPGDWIEGIKTILQTGR